MEVQSVDVQVQISNGLPAFTIVGSNYPDGRKLFLVMIFLLFAFFVPSAGASDAKSDTVIGDKELSALYQAGNLRKMEEIATTGDQRAQVWLGLMFQNRARHSEALKWYSLAGEQGNAWAIGNAAFLHKRGLGTPKSLEAATDWYRKGAEFGNAGHQSNYAYALLQGEGVGKDEQKAFEWLLKSAEQKNSSAYLGLANLYSSGLGTMRDPVKAYVYARMFEKHPIDDSDTISIRAATKIRKSMKKELSKNQLQTADKLIKQLEDK